jgi:hypothetical protein
VHYCAGYTPLPVHPGPRADSHRNSGYGFPMGYQSLIQTHERTLLLYHARHQYQPSFVIEVGCSESHRWLVDDMRLWMMGGRPHVKIVLIIKFARTTRTNEVTGKAELYVCDVSGNPFCQQKAASSPEAATKCREFMVLRSEHRASWLNPHRGPL